MTRWLGITAAAALCATGSAADAQMKGLAPDAIVSVAKTRALDFRLSQELGNQTTLPLMRSIVLRHQLATNAAIGIGLSNLKAKPAAGDLRTGEGPRRSRKPAVTFVLKF